MNVIAQAPACEVVRSRSRRSKLVVSVLAILFIDVSFVRIASGPLTAQERAPAIQSRSAPLLTQPLHLDLEGDGHACSGKLRAEKGHLYWKSSFSVCDSAFQVSAHDASSWTLKLTGPPGKSAHACSLNSVKVILTAPSDYALWQVVGFQGSGATASQPGAMVLACNMQSARASGVSAPHD